jgi:hypothetical protein
MNANAGRRWEATGAPVISVAGVTLLPTGPNGAAALGGAGTDRAA